MAERYCHSISVPEFAFMIFQEARPSPERLDAQLRALSEVQENTLRNMEEQNATLREQITGLRAQNETLRSFCTTMAEDLKENSSLYQSMLEQNKNVSHEAHISLLEEIKLLHSSIVNLQVGFVTVRI